MKSNVTGIATLYALAERLIDVRIPVDVVDIEIGEKAVPRTDKAVVMTLLQRTETVIWLSHSALVRVWSPWRWTKPKVARNP